MDPHAARHNPRRSSVTSCTYSYVVRVKLPKRHRGTTSSSFCVVMVFRTCTVFDVTLSIPRLDIELGGRTCPSDGHHDVRNTHNS